MIVNVFWFIFFVFFQITCTEDKNSPTKNDRDLKFQLREKFQGTTGPVYSIDWSSSGNTLVTSGYSEFNLWDVYSMKHLKRIAHHASYIWCVSWIPSLNRRIIASASEDGTLQLWDEEAEEVITEIGSGWVFCLSWSSDGEKIVYGNSEGRIEVREIATDSVILASQVEKAGSFPARAIISISWSPSKELIAAGCWYGGIRLIDVKSVTISDELDAKVTERYDVNGISFSPDGDLLASVHQDGYLRIWDVASKRIDKTIKAHKGWARGIAWSPDGEFIATGGEDKSVYVWNVRTRKRYTVPLESPQPIWAISWSPNGKQLAIGDGIYNNQNYSGTIHIIEIGE